MLQKLILLALITTSFAIITNNSDTHFGLFIKVNKKYDGNYINNFQVNSTKIIKQLDLLNNINLILTKSSNQNNLVKLLILQDMILHQDNIPIFLF